MHMTAYAPPIYLVHRTVMNACIDWGISLLGHGTQKSTRPRTTISTTEPSAAARTS